MQNTLRTHEKPYPQLKCALFFLLLAMPVLFGLAILQSSNNLLFQILLFTTGWAIWTFIEYIAHRFWMHGKGNPLYNMASGKHRHHHEHPEDRKITPFYRSLLFLIFVILIYLSAWFDNWFTLFAGFYSGFAGFCFLHYVLHKTWSQHIFKRLVRYHIYHHCKYPDRCHGVSITWWDVLFNTKPPKEAVITDRIRQFYFNGGVSGKKAKESKGAKVLFSFFVSLHKKVRRSHQLKCFTIFFILVLPLLFWNVQLRYVHPVFFHMVLFVIGWFSWTFIEYILHRFWSHSKTADKTKPIILRHQHHHTHPTDIKVTGGQRLLMCLVGIVLVWLSIWTKSYFDLLAGFWAGIFWFFQMHYFLHQPWVRKVFPQLLKYHIIHHCKQPDKCFGISTIWWDKLFNTGPSTKANISPRIIEFYFTAGHGTRNA